VDDSPFDGDVIVQVEMIRGLNEVSSPDMIKSTS